MEKKRKVESSRPPVRKSCITGLAILAAGLFLFQIIFVSIGLFPENRGLVGNILITLISFIAVISTGMLYRSFPTNFPLEKKGKFFLFLGVLFFFIGDLLWLYAEIFLSENVPIGSWPDLAWNIGYILIIFSIRFFIATEFRPSFKLFYTLLFLAIIGIGIFLYFDLTEDMELGNITLPHLIQDVYPVYDIILGVMIFYLLWPLILNGNKYFTGWFLLGFGFVTRIVYDITFAKMSEDGSYYTGHPVDLIYVLLYLFVILNNVSKCRILNSNG